MDITHYTPLIIGDSPAGHYALMLVELKDCGACAKPMIRPLHPGPEYGPFPAFFRLTFEAQLKRADWEVSSISTTEAGQLICVSCERQGRASFRCQLCQQVRSSADIGERAGNPAEYLCRLCFTSVTAEQWAEALAALHDAHRYDSD